MSTLTIELLNKKNFDTWKIKMKAISIKNDNWQYVSGQNTRPIVIPADIESVKQGEAWDNADAKAYSDLVLAISNIELKNLKECETSNEVWRKLHDIYELKGPARKATLLKQLTLTKLKKTLM